LLFTGPCCLQAAIAPNRKQTAKNAKLLPIVFMGRLVFHTTRFRCSGKAAGRGNRWIGEPFGATMDRH
jgi:hypothetical protein